jgi:acyl carrier protein
MALSTSEIEVKVIEIVSKQLGVAKEKIARPSSFVNDLGADSLDTVELVMEIEDAFDLSIPDESAEKIQTVGDAIKFIEDHVRDKK